MASTVHPSRVAEAAAKNLSMLYVMEAAHGDHCSMMWWALWTYFWGGVLFCMSGIFLYWYSGVYVGITFLVRAPCMACLGCSPACCYVRPSCVCVEVSMHLSSCLRHVHWHEARYIQHVQSGSLRDRRGRQQPELAMSSILAQLEVLLLPPSQPSDIEWAAYVLHTPLSSLSAR